jgi:hypothetical protein
MNPFVYFAGLIIIAIILATIIDHFDQKEIEREHQLAMRIAKDIQEDVEREIRKREEPYE